MSPTFFHAVLFLGVASLLASNGASAQSAAKPFAPRPPVKAYASPSVPYAGAPNYAHATPVYQWGWFGAERYAPLPHRHRDYYGTAWKWSNRRW